MFCICCWPTWSTRESIYKVLWPLDIWDKEILRKEERCGRQLHDLVWFLPHWFWIWPHDLLWPVGQQLMWWKSPDWHWHIGTCPLEMLRFQTHLPCWKKAWAKSMNDKHPNGERPPRIKRPSGNFQPQLPGKCSLMNNLSYHIWCWRTWSWSLSRADS